MQNLFVLSKRFLFPLIFIAVSVSIWSLFSQSIRLDESQSIWISTKPLTMIFHLTSEDVHVPLYGILLHFWLQIFGNSIIAARALSMIFFLLTLPVLYQFVKEASNKQIAILTLTLFTLSPFIMWYTSEARMYTLFTLVTSLNHLFFLRMITSNAENGKLGYFVTLILGFYTHYFFFFLVATQAMYTLGVYWKRLLEKSSKAFIFKTFGVMVAAGIFFLPWLILVIMSGSASNTQPLIPSPTSYNIIQTFVNFLFGFQTQGIQAVLVSLWPLSVMTLFFIFTKRQRISVSGIEYILLASFVPIILVFLISFFRPIFLSRYLIVVTPTLFFMFAWMLAQYSRKTATIVISAVLFAMLGLMLFQTTSAATPVRENYQGATDYIEQKATPRDLIAVSAPFTIYPIEYSYDGRSRITTIPEWDRYASGPIPPFSLKDLDNRMQRYKKQYERLYLVLSYDQGYEDAIRKYFDGYELVENEILSPNLEIRVYKLRY